MGKTQNYQVQRKMLFPWETARPKRSFEYKGCKKNMFFFMKGALLKFVSAPSICIILRDYILGVRRAPPKISQMNNLPIKRRDSTNSQIVKQIALNSGLSGAAGGCWRLARNDLGEGFCVVCDTSALEDLLVGSCILVTRKPQ